jgi:hypothetical protein
VLRRTSEYRMVSAGHQQSEAAKALPVSSKECYTSVKHMLSGESFCVT